MSILARNTLAIRKLHYLICLRKIKADQLPVVVMIFNAIHHLFIVLKNPNLASFQRVSIFDRFKYDLTSLQLGLGFVSSASGAPSQ